MFQRFFDKALAQSSYLISCERSREAAVVDPRRDVDIYVQTARERGLSLVCAIETHIHADFLSGAKELAALGCRVIAGPGAALGFTHHEASDREQVQLGDIRLTLLHTPGHTPEHISVLVDAPGEPSRVLTGDALFVGAVGRPDLLGADAAQALAEALFDSLHDVLLALDDGVEVHPGHGAGSLCGAGIDAEPSSTIGHERGSNAVLRLTTSQAFAAAVLADLPETPPYFGRMKEINRRGPGLLGFVDPVPGPLEIDIVAVADAVDAGATIIDMRNADAFARAHPAGAIHLEFGPKVGHWAAWVLPADARLILVAEDEHQAADVRRQLFRVGLDPDIRWTRVGSEAWGRLRVASLGRIDLSELDRRLRRSDLLTVLDVRSRREFDGGHITGAWHIPLHEVARRGRDVPGPVATICETGYRASLAASLLAGAGLGDVASVAGGMAEHRMTAASR